MIEAVFGLIGVILGALATGIVSWKIHTSNLQSRNSEIEIERKERFRVMTFEKRLDAYQRAYYCYQCLNEVLNGGDTEKIHEVANEARDWWNKHCLLLDTDSRDNLMGFIQYSHMYANGNQTAQQVVWDWMMKTRKSIVKGVGTEHLPIDSKTPEELRDTM